MTDDLELRTAVDDDSDAISVLLSGAFLGDVEEELTEFQRMVDEPERTHVVEDAGQLVATGGVFTREMTVPGAVIPTAHVTRVAVAPTHRRRGLLRRIMKAQLEAVRDRGTEPIAALWASEGAIYGRFGYGCSAWHVSYEVAKPETSVPGETPAGRLRQVVPKLTTEVLGAVYDEARPSRPGLSGRPGRWWERLTADPKERRHGMSALRGVVYEVGGKPEAYALWRVKGGWGETGPNGEVAVREVVATTPDAYAALWRFLLSIDLTRTVKFDFAAVDEPLTQLVTNPTGLGGSISPSLWVRVVDVPSALAARRYLTPVDTVLDVTDDLLADNAGRWRLVGDADSAKCEPTNADPELSLDVRDLGAAYLGGSTLLSMAGASRVTEHRDGALAAVSSSFGWHRAPAAIEIF